MPRTTSAPRRTAAPTAADSAGQVHFSLLNWILLLVGLVAVVAGFVLLAGGSIVAAPLLLVLGFVVLIPLGIIL